MTSAHRAWVSLLALCLISACAQAPGDDEDTADDDMVNEPPPSSIVDAGGPGDATILDARRPLLDASDLPSHPDAARPDSGSGPVVERDASTLDAGEHDAAKPAPEAAMPMEAAAPEAGAPEAAVPVEAGAPDAGLRCPPGRYSGSFGGRIEALFGIITIDLSGTISIEISAPTDNPNMLPIRNGKLDGKDSDGNPLVATITGTLNCATRRLENGRITNGSYTRPDPIWMTRDRITVNFTGTATAVYNYDPPSATGQWEAVNNMSTRVANGTWSAVLVR